MVESKKTEDIQETQVRRSAPSSDLYDAAMLRVSDEISEIQCLPVEGSAPSHGIGAGTVLRLKARATAAAASLSCIGTRCHPCLVRIRSSAAVRVSEKRARLRKPGAAEELRLGSHEIARG